MDLQLKSILLLGRINGCFPVKDLQSLQYTLKHFIFFYSFSILSVYTMFEGYSFFAQRTVIAEMQPSKIIVLYLVIVNNTISCIITRIWILYRCSRLTELISNLMNIMKDTTYKKGSYIFRYYVLCYIIFSIDMIPVVLYIFKCIYSSSSALPLTGVSESYLPTGFVIPFWLEAIVHVLRQLIQLQTRHFALAIIIFMGVNLLHCYENFCCDLQNAYCPDAVNNVHIIDDEEDIEIEDDDFATEEGKNSEKKVSAKDLNVMVDFTQKLGGFWGSQMFGNQLEESKGDIISTIFTPKKAVWATSTMKASLNLKELSDKFLQIQKYFDDYNKVAGPSFFILIFFSTIGLIHKLYAVASSEFSINDKLDATVRYACKSSAAFLVIAGLSHLGEVISTRMRKWKEQLKCVMLTELLCEKDHDSTNTLTESVVKWDWQLTAMNLFSINHALLPAIAGTMVTYLIVIIQLKVSEGPGQKNETASLV